MIKSDGDKQDFAAQTVRFPDEEDLEALCKMLATTGKKFDQPKTKTIMNIIILRLVELSEDIKLPSRARFLIKDLLEMRDHMWEPRRAVRHYRPAFYHSVLVVAHYFLCVCLYRKCNKKRWRKCVARRRSCSSRARTRSTTT